MSASESERIIAALERLVVQLEQVVTLLKASVRKDATTGRAPITVTIDSREIAQQVVRYSLTNAVRGASSLVGGVLQPPKKRPDGHR